MLNNGYKILIVDDDKETCDLMESFLNKRSLSIFTANSAEEALRIARVEKLNLILSDKRMPGIDGFEMIKRIRGFNQGVHIIMISSDIFDSEAREKMQQLDIFAYLGKPVSYKKLLRLIDELRERDLIIV